MSNYPINIKTLSPLHIGNGEKLTSVGEYVASNSTIRIIDQEHLRGLLNANDLSQAYLEYILNYAENTHVWDFFTNQKIEKELHFTREFPLNAESFNPVSNNILELAIQTHRQKYIPGSSLKGAIRTMVFAYCIYTDPSLKSEIEEIINQDKNDLYKIRKQVQEKEEEWLNGDFNHFGITDSEGVHDENVVAEIARRVHLFGVETDGLDNLRECITAGTQIKTTIAVKSTPINAQLQWLYDEDLAGLFRAINLVMDQYIGFEINLLSKSNNEVAKELIKSLQDLQQEMKQFGNEAAILRLGKGKTYYFQVILPMLNQKAHDKIIQLIVKDEEARANFPETRVLNDYNEMFGWLKVSLPAFAIPEANIIHNKVETLKKDETVLAAYFIDPKTVQLSLNGVLYEKLQLVNKLKTSFRKGTPIQVMVKQITKEGRLNQVELINK
ncbi:MAG: type III-A CRISPR-associated RAMP protein Csm5 [Bacteroidetes bacterium HGW-Bacteroidetes-16]|jgi:CRISPR type III-A-associated RAMP protein Csm5|nr:MAG: type III-A CRISPR-associated RAMP protein Csm5 [Bacteroidetes bacterium HGW-Bacteroidetes-16]